MDFEPEPGRAKATGAREVLVQDGDAGKMMAAVRRLTGRDDPHA